MGSPARDTSAAAAAIVARIPRVEAAVELASELESQVAALERVSADSHAEIVAGLRRSLTRWWRFLSTGVMPGDADFDPLRAWARARATEGVRLEELLRSFGLLRQMGWQLLRRHAHSGESEALLELAGLLAQYVDQVSAVVTETYLAERELLVSEEERRTRTLLDRLCDAAPVDAADRELAERLDVPVEPTYSPFAIVIPGRAPHRHAALATRLRRGGWRLTVTHGESVTGLTWQPLELSDLQEGPQALLAIGEATPRGELAAAREEIAVLAEYGRTVGLCGLVRAEEHLLEIIVGRSPALVQRLRRRIFAPLADRDRAELTRTLQTLLACRLDRTAASAALHVHRNTLAYRLARIEDKTGLDLASPHDLACAYVALAGDVDAASSGSNVPSEP
ncbi:MAG TPA: helix-turn-helix domain-containing protein [Solirubrobacteraceae bacterium]|nr:helix-turn-helix domain-containing protein [Solirubrobacteraceae bacterium]